MTKTLKKKLDKPFDAKRLLPWEEQVKVGALEGASVWLKPEALKGETEEDGPTIRARFLEMLLLGQLGEVHYRGVRFWNEAPKDKPARVIGALNLRGAGTAGQPLPILEIYRFGFDQRPSFDLAHLTFLLLNDCRFSDGIDLQRAHIRGGLFMRGIESRGEINLNGATIGSQLALEDSKLMHEGGVVLSANGATIGVGASLARIEAQGQVHLRAATIGVQLVLVGAKLINQAGLALSADGATIEGSVFAKASRGDPGLVAWGQVNFHSARVKRSFEWDGAVLLAGMEGRPALNAPHLDVQGQAHFLRDDQGRPFMALGGVRFDGAKFHDPFRSHDALLVASAVIGRRGSGWVEGGQWRALSLDDGSAAGYLRFQNATILGAAVFDGRVVTGDVHLDDVVLVAAGSTEREDQNSRPWEEHVDATKEGVALSAVRSTVKGALQMRHFKKPDPSILHKIKIEPLDPEFFGPDVSEHFANAFKDAIAKTKAFMEQARDTCSQVEGSDDHHPQGHFLLWNADIGSLQDDSHRSYPKELGHLHLDGLRYHHLAVKPRHEDPDRRWVGDRRVKWLRRQYPDGQAKEGDFHPQPYDQLAATLRAQGYGRAANTVGAEKRKDARRAKAEQWWDREVVSRIYSLTSNSGYSTVQATAVYVAALALAVVITSLFYDYGGLAIATPKRSMAPETLSWPIFSDLMGYTVDLFIPLLRFGSESRFAPTASWVGELAGLWTYLVRIAGLILTGILALTYTGVTRKD